MYEMVDSNQKLLKQEKGKFINAFTSSYLVYTQKANKLLIFYLKKKIHNKELFSFLEGPTAEF